MALINFIDCKGTVKSRWVFLFQFQYVIPNGIKVPQAVRNNLVTFHLTYYFSAMLAKLTGFIQIQEKPFEFALKNLVSSIMKNQCQLYIYMHYPTPFTLGSSWIFLLLVTPFLLPRLLIWLTVQWSMTLGILTAFTENISLIFWLHCYIIVHLLSIWLKRVVYV